MLKNNKAIGFDIISNEMIKCGITILAQPLTKLLNKKLSTGQYPSQWCLGYICPAFKKGEKDDPANYRGITINSCLGKLFTKVLNNRLDKFLEKREIISNEQMERGQNLYMPALLILDGLLTPFGIRDFFL